MTRKFKKKARKHRGNRSHGYGRCQGRRKAGYKGGHGLTTGWKKHKKSYLYKQRSLGFPNKKYGNRDNPWIPGRKGFHQPQKTKRIYKVEPINISSVDTLIDDWVEEGLAEKSGSKYKVDLEKLGYQKLLSRGSINKKVEIKVKRASRNAVKAVEDAGGSVTVDIKNQRL